jgi:ribonuclease Z
MLDLIDLTLLGCGGNMPMPNRNLSSLFINYKGKSILLDCGEGTQIAMRKYGTGFKDLDLILISHLHGDHVFGLPGLLSSMGNCGKTDPLYIYGPAGICEFVDMSLNMVGRLPFEVIASESPYQTFRVWKHPIFKEIEIQVYDVDHSTECYAYHLHFTRMPEFDIEKAKRNNVPMKIWKQLQGETAVVFEGKKYLPEMVLGKERKGIRLTYITDTRYNDYLCGIAMNSDLLVCESMYGAPEDIEKAEKNKHMLFAESAKIASEGQVKRLVLTHFSPSMEDPENYIENARNVFKNTELGYDGMKIKLNYKE